MLQLNAYIVPIQADIILGISSVISLLIQTLVCLHSVTFWPKNVMSTQKSKVGIVVADMCFYTCLHTSTYTYVRKYLCRYIPNTHTPTHFGALWDALVDCPQRNQLIYSAKGSC